MTIALSVKPAESVTVKVKTSCSLSAARTSDSCSAKVTGQRRTHDAQRNGALQGAQRGDASSIAALSIADQLPAFTGGGPLRRVLDLTSCALSLNCIA